jgi:MFS family permease
VEWVKRIPADSPSEQTVRRRIWAIAGLLLMASAINYMDRQTLAAASVRISGEFELTEEQYGRIESRFATFFALGSLVFGLLADRFSVRWLYPTALCLWSATGFATGWSERYEHLLWCRSALGFFEAAHWPCALKTTQLLIQARGRALGNGVLQSGTSIGAILTPVVMWWIMVQQGWSWRVGFQLVGVLGVFWIIGWLVITRSGDFVLSSERTLGGTPGTTGRPSLMEELSSPRTLRMLLAVLIAISVINTTWQLLRAWLPKVLQQQVGYSESQTLWFTALWFVFTDLGCIGAGYLAYRLAGRGWSVRASRLATFGLCSAACSMLVFVPWMNRGAALLVILLISGAGALGVFPLYYSFTQDISRFRIGLITGVAGAVGWLVSSQFQILFGRWADRSGSFDRGILLAAGLPLAALAAFAFLWPRDITVGSAEMLDS